MIRLRQTGYTLIELLLYVAIVSGLLLSIVAFFGVSVDSRVKNQSISEVNQQATYAMDYITQIVRNATAIASPATGSTGSSLTLTVPTATLSPTTISLNGTTLRTVEGSAAAVALTGNAVQISNLQFTNLSRSGTPGVVQVSFTVTRTNPSGRNEYDYTKTFTTSVARRWP